MALAGLSDIEATHADMQALDKARQATNAKNLAAKAREAEQRKSRIQKAQFLWEASQPIEGILAQLYLKKHRGIKKGLDRVQLRGNSEQAAIHYEAALKALSHSTVTAVEQGYFMRDVGGY